MTTSDDEPELLAREAPASIAPLARLPVFFALAGKRAVVAGGTPAAAWKAQLLIAAGARVEAYAAEPCPELSAMANGTITLHRRVWAAGDLGGAAMAIGECRDDQEAERFARAARFAGVPVNVIDKPAYCDFSFGAIVNRSPLVIGVSTDAAAPALAQAVRGMLEMVIPAGFARWADAAQRWREAVRGSDLAVAVRRRFWQLFASFALAHPEQEPAAGDFNALLERSRNEAAAPATVTLIAIGGGDPDLLTLGALRALQTADVMLIDPPPPSQILDLSRREASKVVIDSKNAVATGRLMVAEAQSGKRVVRVMRESNSDRARTEIAACRAAGITVAVIPTVMAP